MTSIRRRASSESEASNHIIFFPLRSRNASPQLELVLLQLTPTHSCENLDSAAEDSFRRSTTQTLVLDMNAIDSEEHSFDSAPHPPKDRTSIAKSDSNSSKSSSSSNKTINPLNFRRSASEDCLSRSTSNDDSKNSFPSLPQPLPSVQSTAWKMPSSSTTPSATSNAQQDSRSLLSLNSELDTIQLSMEGLKSSNESSCTTWYSSNDSLASSAAPSPSIRSPMRIGVERPTQISPHGLHSSSPKCSSPLTKTSVSAAAFNLPSARPALCKTSSMDTTVLLDDDDVFLRAGSAPSALANHRSFENLEQAYSTLPPPQPPLGVYQPTRAYSEQASVMEASSSSPMCTTPPRSQISRLVSSTARSPRSSYVSPPASPRRLSLFESVQSTIV